MSQTNNDIEEFKKEIRSILITSKDGLPLHQVNRDYSELIGKPIPFRALGFNSAIELFRAVPDAVKIVVVRGDLYLHVVCDENIVHIKEMVSKQKKPTKPVSSRNRSAHRARPVYSQNKSAHSVPPLLQHPITKSYVFQNYQPVPKVPPQVKTNILDLISRHPNGLNVQDFKYAYRSAFKIEFNHQDYNYLNIVDFLKSLENENILRLYETFNMVMIYPIYFKQGTHQNSVVRNEQVTNQNRENKGAFVTEPEASNKKSHSYDRKDILKNLKKVIEHFPGGFPVNKLCGNYKQVTGSVLVPMEMGYNNVEALVKDYEDIFRVQVNRAGDWLLVDARLSPEPENHGDKKEIPEHIQQNIYDLLKHFTDGIDLLEFEQLYKINFGSSLDWKGFNYHNLESMLVSLEFSPPIRFARCELNKTLVILSPKDPILTQGIQKPTVTEQEEAIPNDAVLLGEAYTPVKIPSDEKYFPVLVSSVDSPGDVWLQLVSQTEQRNVELDILMDKLADFYQSPQADKYRIPEKYLVKGLNCAVIYSEDQAWHRGSIIGKHGPASYEVLYYDYGTIDVVEKSLLRLLKKIFAVLPAQAFPARLAKMKPLSTRYSPESSSRVFELCSEKPLMAHLTSTTYMNTNSVILCDTTGEDDVFINDILVHEGLVESSDDQVEQSKPFEVTNPDRCNIYSGSPNYIPAHMPTSIIPQVGFSSPGFYSTVGSIVPQLNPQYLANSMTADSFQPLVPTSPLSNSETYHPPSFNHSLDNSNVLDPKIFRRLEERALARKKLLEEGLNVPQATVEPIQSLKTRTIDCDLTSFDIQENQSETNEPDTPQHVGNYENQETDEMYDSSREDDNPESSSSSVSAYNNPSGNQLRFCKEVCFTDEKYSAYLINFNRQPCFTSAHLSSFIFGVDIVKRILHIQKYPQCHIVASREEHPALFEELERLKISGFTKEDPTMGKIVLYTLSDVLKILVFLNHNKETLVKDIEKIQQSFDPDDEYWMTNEESVKVNTYEETLEEQLSALKEERRLLLRVMLSEDCSSIDDAKRLLKIHEDIHKVIGELLELQEHSKLKSASAQAREFLERAKLDFQTEKCPETSTCVASPSAPDSTPTTPVHVQSNLATVDSSIVCAAPLSTSQNSNMVAVGQSAVTLQGYAPAANPYRVATPISINYPTFFPNNYVYPQQNLQFGPSGMRFPNAPIYYNQWKQ